MSIHEAPTHIQQSDLRNQRPTLLLLPIMSCSQYCQTRDGSTSHVLKFSAAGPQAWLELEIISPPPYQSSAAKFQIDFRGAVCRVLWPRREQCRVVMVIRISTEGNHLEWEFHLLHLNHVKNSLYRNMCRECMRS